MKFRDEVAREFERIQDHICAEMEKADGVGKFIEDSWDRPGGGGGRSRVMKEGAIVEKGGVNFSQVQGELPEKLKKEFDAGDGEQFFATGVSIVIHPHNPWVPIIHMNIRYFEMSSGKWWFGGGIDLTPHYVNDRQARRFHEQIKQVCDKYDESFYSRFKKWADDYFFIEHREETRGVGGIFFDYLSEDGEERKLFEFTKEVGESFAPIYVDLIAENREKDYTPEQKRWQLLRRGRYVEFNLVYDRGTKFGLKTKGRIESILMSLPKHASWEYDVRPEEGSQEQETLQKLKKGIDWLTR